MDKYIISVLRYIGFKDEKEIKEIHDRILEAISSRELEIRTSENLFISDKHLTKK